MGAENHVPFTCPVPLQVDAVNELFAAARDEIEYAKEEAETVGGGAGSTSGSRPLAVSPTASACRDAVLRGHTVMPLQLSNLTHTNQLAASASRQVQNTLLACSMLRRVQVDNAAVAPGSDTL